jgi:AraC-like DNA-binding protein
MQLAARRLREDGASLAEVAQESGYRSEAAFSRAFKQWTGRPPGVVRRSGAAREGQP